MASSELHPLIADAARGRLPDWVRVEAGRRAHLESVAALLAGWADALGLGERDRTRWAAAGWLHDALRDADADELALEAGGYPAPLRHGPATAARLRRAGVEDDELLEAVGYHSLGRGGLGRLGRFLYLADYLDPLRSFDGERRAVLRTRLPAEHEAVLRSVCALRIAHLLERQLPIREETAGFWNELVGAE